MLTLEVEMQMEAATVPKTEPKLYYANDGSFLVAPKGTPYWIAEGTDGDLYLVPAEAGGWLRRAGYEGPSEGLAPVCAEKARTIIWFVYGDVGHERSGGTIVRG